MSGPRWGSGWFDHVQAYRGVAAAVGSRAFGLAVWPVEGGRALRVSGWVGAWRFPTMRITTHGGT